jgi:hypothetical protein
MSCFEGPAPNPGSTFLTELKKLHPHVFLVIFRSKNSNIVAFEAKVKNGVFDPNDPVDVYWLEIDEAYRSPRRRQGINHDRVELLSIERSMAFGVSTQRISDTEIQIQFHADQFSQNGPTPMRVKLSPKGASLFVVHKDTPFLIRSAYVAGTDNIKLLRPSDNVSELTFQVVNMKTKLQDTIRIK